MTCKKMQMKTFKVNFINILHVFLISFFSNSMFRDILNLIIRCLDIFSENEATGLDGIIAQFVVNSFSFVLWQTLSTCH